MMNKEEKERHELMLFLERRKCDLWKSYSDKINIMRGLMLSLGIFIGFTFGLIIGWLT